MSIKRQTVAYGVVAVVIAVSLIVGAVALNPAMTTSTVSSTTSGSAGNQVAPGTTTQSTTTSLGGTTPFVVLLTDPPTVPNGTSSLNLTYSNVEVHTKLNGSSQWVSSNVGGTVDLLQLVNVSQTLAVSNIQNGSIVDQIRFDIASVQIDVNGTLYNVTTPNSQLTIPMSEHQTLQQLSGALVDLSPKVVEIITGNATAPVFVLIPSATAIVRYGSEIAPQQTHLGHEQNLTSNDIREIDASHGNVTILSANISATGNMTSVSVTLENMGNVSVSLSGISIHGLFNTTLSPTSVCSTSTSHNTGSDNGDNNSTTTISENVTTTHTEIQSTNSSGSHDSVLSSSAVATPKQSDQSSSGDSSHGCGSSEHEFEQPHELVFATIANSTTISPIFSEDQSYSPLILQPNTTITLNYTGVITFGAGDNGAQGVSIAIVPIQGSTYVVSVALSEDATSSIQVVST